MNIKSPAASNIVLRIRAECAGRILESEKLSAHTTIKIGGPAECWFEPADAAALSTALRAARELGAPVQVVGGGSNLLAPDEGLPGLTVHLSAAPFKELRVDGDEVTAGAGVPLSQFLSFLVENGFGDCDYLMGYPAQVGGAVMMNAGGATRWIGERVVRVETAGFDGATRTFEKKEILFAYRSSGLRDLVVTRATFGFPRIAPAETRKKLDEYSEYRRKTQDLRFPNAGCMFRNPEGDAAGRLIEQAGLKGARRGGAQVSLVHANFVVNAGGATRKDVLELLDAVEKAVFDKFKIKLHREIRLVG